MRRLVADFHERAGIGSATLFGLRDRHTSRAAISTKFGLAVFTASRPALMPRMALDVFDLTLFARGNNEASFASLQRNL